MAAVASPKPAAAPALGSPKVAVTMPAPPGQELQIEPKDELTFKGPFNNVVTSSLRLKNPTPTTMGFKVKTTAPSLYYVRPNNGFIPPNGEVDVKVMLQPFKFEGNKPYKHKFLVQSFLADKGTTPDETAWRSLPKEKLQEHKLRCLLLDGELPEPSVSPVEAALRAEEEALRAEVQKLQDENRRLTNDIDGLRERFNIPTPREPLLEKPVASAQAVSSTASRSRGRSCFKWLLILAVIAGICYILWHKYPTQIKQMVQKKNKKSRW